MSSRVVKLLIIQLSIIGIFLPFNNCSQRFSVQEFQSSSLSSPSSSDNADLSVIGKTVYSKNCASCHGSIDVSSKKDRSYDQIMTALNTIGAMNSLRATITSDQITAVAAALRSSTTGARLQYACDPAQVSKSTIQRLSNRELKNTVYAILKEADATLVNDTTLNQTLNNLPADNTTQKENTLLLTPNLIQGHFDLAYRIATLFASSSTVTHSFPGTSACLEAATITSACAETFVKELGLRAFRRPLLAAEITSFKNIFFDSSASSNADRITLATASILMAPDFHYQIYDHGVEGPSKDIKLNSYEFASRMSYFLIGAPPDATLRGLAANSTILDPSIASQQAQRLLGSTQGKENVIRFFREWLHYDRFETFNYSNEVLNGQSLTNLQSAMVKEVDDFVSDLTINSNGTYRNLLLSTQSNITDSSLAQVYGITNPSGKTSLPSQERAGLLTRAAMLSKRSGALTSPVKRGLFIKEALLCEGIGSPPPNAPTMLEPLPADTYLTTRDRLSHLTMQAGSSCIACHAMMNNLGFPFEMYDTLGRFRRTERIFLDNGTFSGVSLNINTVGETKDLSANTKVISDALNLSEELADNDKSLACFSKKWNEFRLRRAPSSTEGCVMNNTLQIIYGGSNQQGSFQDVIKGTILSDDFKQWNY